MTDRDALLEKAIEAFLDAYNLAFCTENGNGWRLCDREETKARIMNNCHLAKGIYLQWTDEHGNMTRKTGIAVRKSHMEDRIEEQEQKKRKEKLRDYVSRKRREKWHMQERKSREF